MQTLRSESLKILLASDYGAGGILGIAVVIWHRAFMQSPGSVSAGSPLLKYDSALLVDLCRVVGHEMGIIVHYEYATVYYRLVDQRYVRQHILCTLHAGGGVDVAAEGRAYTLEIVKYTFVREVFRSVKAHMLEEMRQTVLIRGLLDGAHMGRKIEFRSSGRYLVMPDVIGHTVVQLPYLHGWIIRQYLHLTLSQSAEGDECGCNKYKKSFHYQVHINRIFKDNKKSSVIQYVSHMDSRGGSKFVGIS